MSKILEVIRLLPDNMLLADVLDLAEKIDSIYATSDDPLDEVRVWASNRVSDYYVDHKIAFIKEIKSVFDLSLKDAKDIAEQAISEHTLNALRDRLNASAFDSGDLEDRAFAESRERMSEQGTWFGAPGPMDEEPF
jgi:hypothetical protein